MAINPFILGRSMAGQIFQKNPTILALQHFDCGIQKTFSYKREAWVLIPLSFFFVISA
jgi:hypothetical protein